MTDIEKTSKDSAPFQSECNTSHFFAGGGRGVILKDLQEALSDKTELVTLIGEEGSGKTMLCKMLQEQWETTHKIIFMPSVVKSFEDVSRVAAQECNMEYPVVANRADAKKIFLDLMESLQSKGVSLLLICDEAEKMYLATLERIRKILDDVNAQGGGLQVLLAGRKNLERNLEQLALCDFNPIVAKQFFLSTLDQNETWSYLNFCVQRYRGTEEKEVFTKEAAAKIATMGKGNLRMINMYADESLQSSSDETSFLVLLDHVKDGGADDDDRIDSGSGPFSSLSFSPKYVLGGGFLLALLLVMFLFSGGDEEKIVELKKNQSVNPVFTNPPKQMDKEVEKPVVVKQEKEVKKALPSKASQDPVLGKFVAVGEKWQAGEADSSFSIQIMSLISEQAEENLKQIVSQPEYQAVADKLVVLTRPSDPPVILVFYGVYPSMVDARNARNNMPIFLRDRYPYPVSVRGAVEKARVE
jgi:type II secretory pathway predicted ATPase ExeA